MSGWGEFNRVITAEILWRGLVRVHEEIERGCADCVNSEAFARLALESALGGPERFGLKSWTDTHPTR